MSLTFSLICPSMKLKIWIGQGHTYFAPKDPTVVMDTFYSGEEKTMKNLHSFLQTTMGKKIMLVCDDHYGEDHPAFFDYTEHEPKETISDWIKRKGEEIER